MRYKQTNLTSKYWCIRNQCSAASNAKKTYISGNGF